MNSVFWFAGLSFAAGVACRWALHRLLFQGQGARVPGPPDSRTTLVGQVRVLELLGAGEQAYDSLWLHCHGNGGSIEGNWADHLERFRTRHGLAEHSVLATFDYRGYGHSTGTPTPDNAVEDGLHVLAWLLAKHRPKRVFLLGTSLGAWVVSRMGPSLVQPPAGVFLDVPFLGLSTIRSWPGGNWLPDPLFTDTTWMRQVPDVLVRLAEHDEIIDNERVLPKIRVECPNAHILLAFGASHND